MRPRNDIPPAVVTTMSYSGLAIVRSLARRGVKVYAVAGSKGQVGMSSRFAHPIVLPNFLRSEKDSVEGLVSLARRIGRRAVLFPTGDVVVLALSRNRDTLSRDYAFTIPDPSLVERLVSKAGLAHVLEQQNFPRPLSLAINTEADLDRVAQMVTYPVLMKPAYSASWYLPEMVKLIGVRKAIVMENEDQLRQQYAMVSRVDPRIVVQEWIPGADALLYYVCGYCNAAGKVEAIFAGQKLRITPIHFGSASFVKSVRDENLLKTTQDFLESLGYKGLFGVEFKKDPRDGVYKVVEVNVRFGLWDGLARHCGIDLAYLAYAREVGLPYEVKPDYRTGVRWLSFRRDLDAFLDYRRERSLTFWPWVMSLVAETEHAVWAWDDPLPALFEARDILRQEATGLWLRLNRRLGRRKRENHSNPLA